MSHVSRKTVILKSLQSKIIWIKMQSKLVFSFRPTQRDQQVGCNMLMFHVEVTSKRVHSFFWENFIHGSLSDLKLCRMFSFMQAAFILAQNIRFFCSHLTQIEIWCTRVNTNPVQIRFFLIWSEPLQNVDFNRIHIRYLDIRPVAAGETFLRWGCGTLAQQTISQFFTINQTVRLISTQLL